MTLISKSVLLTKLDVLKKTISRIESKGAFELNELKKPGDLQDIILFNLQKAVQNSVDIAAYILKDHEGLRPQTMADTFEGLHEIGAVDKEVMTDMKKAVGLRNVIVHEYDEVDWEVVNDVVKRHLPIFKKFSMQILNFTNKS